MVLQLVYENWRDTQVLRNEKEANEKRRWEEGGEWPDQIVQRKSKRRDRGDFAALTFPF